MLFGQELILMDAIWIDNHWYLRSNRFSLMQMFFWLREYLGQRFYILENLGGLYIGWSHWVCWKCTIFFVPILARWEMGIFSMFNESGSSFSQRAGYLRIWLQRLVVSLLENIQLEEILEDSSMILTEIVSRLDSIYLWSIRAYSFICWTIFLVPV